MLTLTSPVETRAHRLPAGAKLLGLCLFTAVLFWLRDPLALGAALCAVLALAMAPGPVFLSAALRQLRPLWPFLLVLAVWHGATGALADGAGIALRLLAAVLAATLVTMTTRLSDMIAVMERLARPLAPIGLPPRRLALAVALVIRFIPVLSERVDRLAEAMRARSPRRRSGLAILPAATWAALDDAEQVAEALRARGGAG